MAYNNDNLAVAIHDTDNIITEENIRGKYYDFGRDKKKKQEKVYDNDKGYGRNSGGQPDYCCECSTWKNEKNVEGDIEKGAGCDRSIPLRFKYGGTRSGKLWIQNYRSYHEL